MKTPRYGMNLSLVCLVLAAIVSVPHFFGETESIDTADISFDLSIAGDGYFQVMNPDGTCGYTKNGQFTLNSYGELILVSSDVVRAVEPAVYIPLDAAEVRVASGGLITYREQGANTITAAGMFQIAQFENETGLLQIGDSIYVETEASGPSTLGSPGEYGAGEVRRKFKTQSDLELNSQLVVN